MKSFFLGLLALSVLSSCSENQAAPGAAVEAPVLPLLEVTAQNTTTIIEYPASIQGAVNVEIRAQVSGNLEKVLVDEGDFVKEGQTLFKVNDQPYREQLNSALGTLHAAEAAVINAALEVDRLTPLVENKVISEFQLKAAKAAHNVALANAEQARAMVGSAKINLGYTTIKAPVSGYIGRLPKKQGSLVSPADPEALTLLSDIHNVHAYFSLGERDFIRFKSQYKGNSVEEKLKQVPPVGLRLADQSVYTEPGKIDMVDGQFDKTTGAITLRASFPNAKGLLRSGNTGKVQLQLEHPGAVLVPQASTVEIQDKTFVFLVDKGNKVTKQPIVIEGKTGTDYLVKEGLKAGDKIVVKGFENLQEGVVISPEKSTDKVAKN